MTNPTPAEIEAALATATPGPWGVHPNYEWANSDEGTTGPILSWDVHGSDSTLIVDETEHEPDAALIAAAPGWLRWLLDENTRMRAALEEIVNYAPFADCLGKAIARRAIAPGPSEEKDE